MNAIERRPTEDTRARIMEVAWDLFRELGARTTVADVAARLGMSSANVYRFFPSKQALCEAVAANQLGCMSAAAREMASADAPAAERLRAILLTLFQAMRDQMTNEARVHEIVDIAIREHWAPIQAYELQMAEMLAGVIADGQAAGEFGPGDPQHLAAQTLCSCVCIHHPLMMTKFAGGDARLEPGEVVDFALRALANREPGNGSRTP
jgi:AcrR family transcriptional regulator